VSGAKARSTSSSDADTICSRPLSQIRSIMTALAAQAVATASGAGDSR
jgi:hypothetical protein